MDRSTWPAGGAHRKFLEFLDSVHRANGMKTREEIARAMNLVARSRVSALLRGHTPPADEDQAANLVAALGGLDHEVRQGIRLFRSIGDTRVGGRRLGDRDAEGRRERLADVRTEAEARRKARLTGAAVPGHLIPALIAWMDALEEPNVVVPRGGLRALVGPMGAGKTELAHRWFVQGFHEAEAETTVEPPIWMDAREASPSLRTALAAIRGADKPSGPCRIVLDRLNGVDAVIGRQLLEESRQLVAAWTTVSVLVTTRPGLLMAADEELAVAPWEVGRGVELVELVTSNPVPAHLVVAEIEDALRSPLSAHAIAARLATGQATDISRWQLLAGLASRTIQGYRPDQPTEALWLLLMRLAQAVLDNGGPVPRSQLGTEQEAWQVTDSGLVSQNSAGQLSFVLPVFEQHFGAEAIRRGLLNVDEAADGDVFPRWRYALAFAVGEARPEAAEDLLERIARRNPAAASWILDELDSEVGHAGSAEADANGAQIIPGLRTPRWTRGLTSTVALGQWLRSAQAAWLDGLHPLGSRLVRTGSDGNPVRWGIWNRGNDMAICEAYDSGDKPAVIELTEPPWGDERRRNGWARTVLYTVPTQPYGRWHWSRRALKQELAKQLHRGTLPCPDDSPLVDERLWLLAQLIAMGGTRGAHEPISVGLLVDKTSAMLAATEGAVVARWPMGGYTVDRDDVCWLRAMLPNREGPELHRPAPRPDRLNAFGRWVSQQYSPERARELAEHTLRAAVAGYRDLVELNFPAFGAALGLYSMLPIDIIGVVELYADEAHALASGLTCVFRPGRGSLFAPPHVDLTVITEFGQHEQINAVLGSGQRDSVRPLMRFAPREMFDRLLELNRPRPATRLAYAWLIEDLQALGWADRGLELAE